MKITANDLPAIDRSSKFTRTSGFSPEFEYLCFDGDTIRAFNGFAGIVHLLDRSMCDKRIVISGDKVVKLLRSLGADLEVETETTKLVSVKSIGFDSKLNITDVDNSLWDFDIPPYDEFVKFPGDFFPAIRQVYFSVSKDETKGEMRGIYVDGKYVYSTDNFRMSRFPIEFENQSLVMPDSLLELIVEEPNPIGYCIKDSKLWVMFSDFLVFTTVFPFTFPACNQIFDSFSPDPETGVSFDSAELTKVLERLEFLSCVYPNRADVIVETPNLVVVTQGPGVQEAAEVVNCDCSSKNKQNFSVNLKFFKDSVQRSGIFYVGPRFLLFTSKTGLENILLFMELKGENLAESFLGRVGKDFSSRGKAEGKVSTTSSGRTRKAKN